MALYNKHNFRIAEFCDKGSSRPEISGVFIEPNKTTATDSYVLVQVSTPKQEGEITMENYPIIPNKPKPKTNFKPFILPAEEAKKLIKPLSRKVSLPILENAVVLSRNEDTAEIGATNLESYDGVFCRIIEGEYPKVNDFLVERGSFIEILVNPEFLEKLGKFFSQFLEKKGKFNGITIKIPKETDKPIRFYAKTETQEAKALLMPIKS